MTAYLYNGKLLTELSNAELREVGRSIGGLPVPPDSAPFDDYLAWMAASMFISCKADAPDPETAADQAASLLLSCGYGSRLFPYVEKALGRKLSAAEIAMIH